MTKADKEAVVQAFVDEITAVCRKHGLELVPAHCYDSYELDIEPNYDEDVGYWVRSANIKFDDKAGWKAWEKRFRGDV